MFATVAGRNSGGLGDEVLRRMLPCTCHTEAEVISSIRGAEQVRVGIQILRSDFEHRPGLLQRGGDVLGCTALDDIGLICFGGEKCLVCFQLFVTHHAFGFGFAVVVQNFLGTASLEGGKGSHHIGRCLFQLTTGQFVGDSLGAGFGFLPVPTVVTDVVSRRRITQFPGEVLC